MSFQLYFYISTDQNTLVYIYALVSGNDIYGVDYESIGLEGSENGFG
jgi:hypothetical protein